MRFAPTPSFVLRLLALLAFLVSSHVVAQARTQMGPSTRVSQADIAAAIQNSSVNSSMRSYGNDIASLAMFESGGNPGVYNGTCCTGLLQVNRSNLAAQGLTPQQYANMGTQQQVDVWLRVTNQGANTAVVRQLQQMQQNGQTFDGRPVDGALILSCIQLGTGNCQKMVRSGSCSGFADSNGTTICKMADKVRGGSNGETTPNNSDPNSNDTGGTGQASDSTSEAALRQILESSKKCWICEIVTKTSTITSKIVPLVVQALVTPGLPLMAVLFGVFLVFIVGRVFLWPGSFDWTELFMTGVRFTVVYALIASSTFSQNWVVDWGYNASTNAGIAIGQIGSQMSDQAFNTQSQNGDCVYDVNNLDLTAIRLGELSCRVHNAAYGPVVASAMLLLKKQPTGLDKDSANAAIIMALAFFLAISAFTALGAFAMSIVEALLRMGIVLALSPLFLFLWVFRRTRSMSTNALQMLLYAFFLLSFSGVLAAMSVYILHTMLGLAIGQQTASIQDVYNYINSNPQMTNFDSGENLAKFLKFALFAIAAGLVSSHLIRAGSSIAASLTQVQGLGEITRGVMSGVMTTASTAIMGPTMVVGSMAAHQAGGAAGSLLKGAIAGGYAASSRVGGAVAGAVAGGYGRLTGSGGGGAGRLPSP